MGIGPIILVPSPAVSSAIYCLNLFSVGIENIPIKIRIWIFFGFLEFSTNIAQLKLEAWLNYNIGEEQPPPTPILI